MSPASQRFTEADQLYGQVMQLLSSGDTVGAMRLLDELTSRFPGYAKGWFKIGEILMSHLSDAESAVDYFRKAIEAEPGFASAYLGYAEALFVMERYPEVNAVLNQVMEVKGARKDIALFRSAMLLESQGRFDEAAETYRKAILVSFAIEEIKKCEDGIARCFIKKKYSK